MLDPLLAGLPAEEDGDLMLCRAHGVAYQKDRQHIIQYDQSYWNKCAGYEGQEIAQKINAGREQLVNDHLGASLRVLDIGVGSGEFVRHRPNTFGYDVNPFAVDWLRRQDLLGQLDGPFSGFTFWDVIEHVPDPTEYLRHVKLHSHVFVSVPIFDSLDVIRLSKHYRPGEHLQYWTLDGFVRWMDAHGFACLETRTFEMEAGRESIYSFAFKRWRNECASKYN